MTFHFPIFAASHEKREKGKHREKINNRTFMLMDKAFDFVSNVIFDKEREGKVRRKNL